MREPKTYDTFEAADKTSSEIPPQGKNAHVYAALVSFTLIGMGSAIATIMLPVLIVDQLHGTTAHVAQMVGLGAFAEIPMMLFLGGASRRINKANMICRISCISRASRSRQTCGCSCRYRSLTPSWSL
jgi:SET family sugar efflux transporter-like MFS transporter